MLSFLDPKYNQMYSDVKQCLDPKQAGTIENKYLESIVNQTNDESGIQYFWKVISKMDLEKNPMITWKFCILLHNTTLNGNPNIAKEIKDEMEKFIKINSVNQIQVNPCYGPLNQEYIRFLTKKINFHRENQIVPSTIQITLQQLLLVSENNIGFLLNIYKEIAEYMEYVLSLFRTITTSISMIQTGIHLRVMALSLLIAESYKIYFIIHDLLSYLHQNQPYHYLEVPRYQFNKIHLELYSFYKRFQNDKSMGIFYNVPILMEICPTFVPLGQSQMSMPTYPSPMGQQQSNLPDYRPADAPPPYELSAHGMYPGLPIQEPTVVPYASAPPIPEKH